MTFKKFSFQKVAYVLLIIALVIYAAIIGKYFIAPLFFGLLGAILLKPICSFYEKYIPWQVVSILLALITASIPVIGGVIFFSIQLMTVIEDLPSLGDQITSGVNEIINWVATKLKLPIEDGQKWFLDNFSTIFDTPIQFIGQSISSSTTILAAILLVIIYSFLLLLYRSSFKNFLIFQFPSTYREEAKDIILNIQNVTQRYLYGLLIVILILGVLNSIGLEIIGIQYAIFWGFLAAFLAIIPYIGTTLGGTLPFLYSLATTDTYWQPIAVVLFYAFVQNIEGNFITPKVVGSSVKINPLSAIISLILGGMIWGIAGLILALPLAAITKIIFEHIDPLKPFGELMGSDIYQNKTVFEDKYDEDKYRIISYFKKDKK